MDPRHERLAELLIHHSTRLQAGEHVLIEAFDIPESMVIAAVKAAKSVGAHPHVTLRNNRLQRALIEDATDAQVATQAEYDRFRMEKWMRTLDFVAGTMPMNSRVLRVKIKSAGARGTRPQCTFSSV